MKPIPATSTSQPDQAQFELFRGHTLDKWPSGNYTNTATIDAWINYSAGWLACSAQQAPAKAIPLIFHEWRGECLVSCTALGRFSVDKSSYRDGYAACIDDENIDPDQTLSTVLSIDDAKAICQNVFNRLVLELVEGAKSCN